jgi:ABC-type transport system involved in multi-copper enzyme maturation permease subunit
MKRFGSMLILHCLQLAHQTKTWVGPILFACVAGFYIFRGGASLGAFLLSPGSVLILTFMPLVVSAGVVSDDVRTGRVLWLHTFGAGRTAFIVSKIVAATLLQAISLGIPLLAFFVYLGLTGHGSSWRLHLFVQSSIFLYFLYWSAYLVLLSTFLKSWANSALAYALQLSVPFILVPLSSRMPGLHVANYVVTVFCGPAAAIYMVGRGLAYPPADLAVTFVALGLFAVAASYIYRHTAVGEALKQE